MWIFKYLVCLVKDHNWIGSHDRYCLRCGKLEIAHDNTHVVGNATSESVIIE
jgi:hypothetical protein